MTHSSRAAPALARLPEVDPAIAALALRCSYRDGDGPTVTEGETIRLGPEFPLLPISEQTGVIAHHVLHVALRHSMRRAAARERFGASFHAERYDLACDALINEALLQGGHALPRPAVRAGDMVAMLPPKDRPDNVLADWDSDRLYAAIAVQSGQSADKRSGTDQSIETYAKTQGFKPDLQDGSKDNTQPELWAGRIEQAMSAGARAGTGIGAIMTRFGDLPKATVPWEIKLRRLLNKALAHHPRPTYRRPGRAWLARDALARLAGSAQPVFEPGTAREDRRPRLVICLDTSSSMPRQTLDMFASEALSITRRTGAETHLLGFDTEVHSRAAFLSPSSLGSMEMRTGGGTDYAPVLAEAQSLDPSLIIMLTDLDAPTGPAPSAPVLWAVAETVDAAPPYGDVLAMKDPQAGRA
ncbi:MAG: VWA-like domain-containing protein [Pseudomonadota bacterium]